LAELEVIVNDTITGIIAILIGYLIGSIPSAYIITRLATGKDIRKLGSGNAGGHNVMQEVGKWAGAAVGIFDIGKGAAAVAIAYRLLNVPLYEPQPFVVAAGAAAVVGHIWSVYLKFTGGNGLATTMGILCLLMPRPLLIVVAVALILSAITRNPVLAINIGLLTVPFSAWLLEKSGVLVLLSIALLVIMVLHFLPTAINALIKAGSGGNLFAELLRRDKHRQR
jgi:glycerol-3-phosphate acyltransferase PlsY